LKLRGLGTKRLLLQVMALCKSSRRNEITKH
jgi:hypothetical protein